MIHIGVIKQMGEDNNTAIVRCVDIDADVECVVLQTLGNAGDVVYKQDEQVVIYMQSGRNVLLGAVYSNHVKPNLTELVKQIIEILKNMKVTTSPGGGVSGTPLPDVVKKIAALEADFKTFLNVK